jgi:hypothetical protein
MRWYPDNGMIVSHTLGLFLNHDDVGVSRLAGTFYASTQKGPTERKISGAL